MNISFGEPQVVEIIDVLHWGIDGGIVQEVYECGHSITYHESAFSPAWCEHHGYAPDTDTRRCWQCACVVEPERKSKPKKKIVSVQVTGVRQLELWA